MSYPSAFKDVSPGFENPVFAPMVPDLTQIASYGDSSFGLLEPFWLELRAIFYPEVQAVYAGQKTGQEALDSYVAKANEILDAYWANN